jgi:LuxR family maltose regulon positive regulatory protein
MAALRSLNIGLDEPIQAISQAAVEGIPLASQMTVFLNDFARLPAETADVILVLDDYHVIQNPVVHNSMAFALEYLPDRLHIVIAGRGEPHLPLAKLRAHRQLNELRASDLRFTPEETEAFLNQSSRLALSSAHLAALEDRTEGWIAGLQMAALALSGRSDIDTFVKNFTGSHRYILDYLVDEVFSRQPPDISDFLLKTSILERMTAGLCDAVTGQENGHVMLSRLERENLFIVSLDDQGQWYRYHHRPNHYFYYL